MPDPFFRKGPDGDEPEISDPDALPARQLDGPQRGTGRDPVRDDHNLSFVQVLLLNLNDVVAVDSYLVHQAVDVPLLGQGVHAGIAALVVGQAGDVDAIALAGDGHGRHVAVSISVGAVAEDAKVIWFHVSPADLGAVDNLDLFR